jgi:hypothetical protein
VVTADLNGDGKIDFAVGTGLNAANPAQVSIEVGHGDGTFQSAGAPNAVGPAGNDFIRSMTAADLDGDGKPDLITANFVGNSITVLQNTTSAPGATPTFVAQPPISLGSGVTQAPFWIIPADVDGDGKTDLIVAGFQTNTISVLRNTSTGPGNFSFALSQFTIPGAGLRAVEAADIDGDGKVDLVTANINAGTLSVLHNASTGPGNVNFVLTSTVSVPGTKPQALVLADFDGDHKPDVAFADQFAGNPGAVYVLTNQQLNQGGSFPNATKLTMPVSPSQAFGLVAGDFNGDGNTDLAVATTTPTVYVFYGHGDGTFPALESYTNPVMVQPQRIASGDFNGDGAPDLIVSNGNGTYNGESILLNKAAATSFQVTPATTTPGAGTSFNVTVTALSGGAPYQNYLGTVTLTSDDSNATTLGTHTFVAADHGSYTFTVSLPDAQAVTLTASDGTRTGTAQVTVVAPGTVVQALPADTLNVPYNQTITATGSTLAVSNIENAIPGLIVPSSGTDSLAIGGTPTATGTEVFTVTATDTLSNTTTTTYSITVNPGLTLSQTSLPADTVNLPYNQSIQATGGTGAVTLAVSNIANAIPGLNVPASGSSLAITGIPTAAGTESFTITATDALGATTTANYSITVNPAIAFTPATSPLPADTIGHPDNQSVAVSGGTGSLTLALANSFPLAGLSVAIVGTSVVISGTPTTTGTNGFDLTAYDSAGSVASMHYTYTVNPAPSLSALSPVADTTNVAYSQTITGSGGTGTLTLAVSNIVNPIPGLNLPSSSTASLAITGTPTAPGTETFTVTVTDSVGVAVSANYSITVRNPVPTLSNVSITPSVAQGSPATLTGTINGPGNEPFTLIVNWGDGSTAQTFNLPAGTTTFSEPHTYSNPGTDSVSVTMGDGEYSTDLLYGSTGSSATGQLFVFDLSNGNATFVGSLPGANVTEIAVNNTTGQAWLQYGNNVFKGQQFNINTGAAIGSAITDNPGENFNALVFIGNTLYASGTASTGGTSPSDLRILDPNTGTSTLIGATGINGPVSGMAFNPATGILYGIKGGNVSTNNLVTINLATGVATTLFSTGFAGSSLAFGPDGQLYAGSNSGQLFSINLGTQAVTSVSATGLTSAISGLAMGNEAADVQTSVYAVPTLSIGGAATVNEGSTYTLNLSGTGPSPNVISNWTITWGDGSPAQTVTGNPTSVTHVYADGTHQYTISATATDQHGTYAAGNTVAVTVNNVPPTLSNISITSPINETNAATLSGNINDPGILDPFTMVVNWGDGSPLQTFNFAAGSTTFSENHTYAAAGNYSVSLTLGDNDHSGAAFYAADTSGHLFTVNLSTGTFTPVGTLPGTNITEIAYDNFAGQAWLQYGNNQFKGQQFNIATGAAIGSAIADVPAENFNGLAFNGAILYASGTATTGGTSPSDLRLLNPATGQSTLIGTTGINGPLSGLAYDPYSGILYGIRGGNTSTNNLVTLNLNTGVATTLFSTGFAAGSLGYGPDGQLYAGTNTGQLYRVDLVHQTASLVGSTGLGIAVSGLAVVDTVPKATASTSIVVNHVPPTLSLSGAATVNEASTYTLNLSGSETGAETISGWTITWGDGAVQNVTGNPSSVTHTYAAGPNNYTISATATDQVGTYNAGNTVNVTVNHVPPTLTLSGAAAVNEGSTYTLNLSGSETGPETITGWTITWGDGSSAQTVTGNPSSVSHIYVAGPNNYTISATATDQVGTYNAGNTVSVTVNDVPPQIVLDTTHVALHPGDAFTRFGMFTDPGANTWTATVDYGDGGGAQPLALTGHVFALSHAYSAKGDYTITVVVTDNGGASGSVSFPITISPTLPVLEPIPDYSIPHTQGSLQVGLFAHDSGSGFTYSAVLPAQVAYNLEQQLGLSFTGNLYLNYGGQQDKWLLGSGGVWYFLLSNGSLYRWDNTPHQATGSLVGTLTPSYYATPSLLYNAPVPPAVQLGIVSGNQLVITPPPMYAGTFEVLATANNGDGTASQSFHVTVTNAAPVLSPIGDQTLSHEQGSLQVGLSATDADGDSLTYGAVLPAQVAHNLDQQLGLIFTGDFSLNYGGKSDKWLLSSAGVWYFLLPDGSFYRWDNTPHQATGTLVATLTPTYYATPSLLYNASAPPPAQLGIVSGNQIVIHPAASFVGTFEVLATVTDGLATTTQHFSATVTNNAPTLSSISNQVMPHSQASLTVPLAGFDSDGDALTYQAVLPAALAHSLGLTFTGDYSLNYGGKNDEWLQGNGGVWYFLLPDGSLYRWDGTPHQATGTLVAALTTDYYQNPSLLYNAPAAPAVQLGIVAGNQLVIDPATSFVGTFDVVAYVSDGVAAAARHFTVTVTNSVPTVAPVSDQTTSSSAPSLQLPISASDTDGDTVSLSVQAGSLGFVIGPKYGLTFTGNYSLNYGGTGEEWLLGSGGNWYFLQPNGRLYQWDSTPHSATGTLQTTLDPFYFYHPELLYNRQPGKSLAQEMQQALGLSFSGNDFLNYGHANEKWLEGSGGLSYFIKPNGDFYRWDGTPNAATGTLLAHLDPPYYTQLDRLYAPTSNPFTVSLAGSTLTVAPANSFIGSFAVLIQASDGVTSSWQWFQVHVTA